MSTPSSPKPAVSPVRWTPPPPAPAGHPTTVSDIVVHEVSGFGPEDVLQRPDGTILAGVDDGRILAVDAVTGAESLFADTGGRPLGLENHPDGGIVVCDSERGLLHVGDDGTVTVLADTLDGRDLGLTNNAAVAPDGTIFFTSSTTRFGLDHWRADIIEHTATGALIRRDPDGTLTRVVDGLAFANGVALLPDGSSVIVAETGAYQLHRIWLTGADAGRREPFGPVLPGFPDNISTGEDGLVWVAVAAARNALLDRLLPMAPWLRKVVWRLPEAVQPHPGSTIHVQAYDADGALVHDIVGHHPTFGMVTGARQVGDRVWAGSISCESIASISIDSGA